MNRYLKWVLLLSLSLATACGGPPSGSPIVRETRKGARPVTFYYGLRPGHRYVLTITAEPRMPIRLLLDQGVTHLREGRFDHQWRTEKIEVQTPYRRVITAEPAPFTWGIAVNALPRKEGRVTVELWNADGRGLLQEDDPG